MTTYLVTYYDTLQDGVMMRIQDGARYVEALWTSEMEANVPREAVTGAKKLFLQALCNTWFDLTGERLEPLPPSEPGVAWMLVQESIDGEVVTGEIEGAKGEVSQDRRHDGERLRLPQHTDGGRLAIDAPPDR